MTDNSNATNRTTQSSNNSTLIEFPGVNRNRPAWRKELSERFREIQQRRAREAALEAEKTQVASEEISDSNFISADAPTAEQPAPTSKQLGLVPPQDEPEVNPIVAAALRRLERARSQSGSPTVTRQGGGRSHAATAAARKVEERVEAFDEPAPVPTRPPVKRAESLSAAATKPAPTTSESAEAEREQTRTTPLAVVQPAQTLRPEQPSVAEAKATAVEAEKRVEVKAQAVSPVVVKEQAGAPAVEAKVRIAETEVESAPARAAASTAEGVASATESNGRKPRHLEGVIDEFWLERHGVELLPKVAAPEVTYDDRAPRAKRIAASIFDLLAVAFLSAPFAALIELTIGNWGDPRVYGSMAGIVAVVMFLYQTCSVALAGGTWGMSLCSLHVVDGDTANAPTTGQCMRRAIVFMLSLATLCLGILYSLFDAEGRTAHDMLSGTVVVKQ